MERMDYCYRGGSRLEHKGQVPKCVRKIYILLFSCPTLSVATNIQIRSFIYTICRE